MEEIRVNSTFTNEINHNVKVKDTLQVIDQVWFISQAVQLQLVTTLAWYILVEHKYNENILSWRIYVSYRKVLYRKGKYRIVSYREAPVSLHPYFCIDKVIDQDQEDQKFLPKGRSCHKVKYQQEQMLM